MKKAVVILNEQHSLMPNQIEILNRNFSAFEIIPVPASGWSLSEMFRVSEKLRQSRSKLIFASPVPGLMSNLHDKSFFVFHNDKRAKKELPGGKIIMTVAQDGWVITGGGIFLD